MDLQDIVEYLGRIPKSYYLPIGLSCVGIVLVGYGLIQVFHQSSSTNSSTQQVDAAQVTPIIQTIAVDIEGAVIHPGVYKLSAVSRVQDGLIAAGGLSQDADREYVAKNLNLAQRIIDGAKVYIPTKGIQNTSQVSGSVAQDSQINTSAGININTASETDLDSLPGVGPVTAQKIISGRPYTSVSELLDRKIVSSKVYGQIKDKVTIY